MELTPLAAQVRDALTGRGALFFRQLSDAVGPVGDTELLLAIWELVWAGMVTNDTLAPLRVLVGGGTRRAATAARLLDRHGVVTRGAVTAERVPGGFAGAYAVLKVMEEGGRCRRGYFVDGLGGAQFAAPGAVDRLRGMAEAPRDPQTVVLAAADPANPYGAALAWPERPGAEDGRPGHRPGRKAGAVVALVDGELALYVEKGGRTLLTFSDDRDRLGRAADALALAVRDGALGRLAVEKADGEAVLDSPLAQALTAAGFRPSTRGLRLQG